MAEVREPVEVPGCERPSHPEYSYCIAAFEALSDRDIRKLKSYARLLLSTVRGTFHHTEADDLLNEAFVRTFDGRRKWKPEQVDFLTHLMGCTRSIVHDLKKKAFAELAAMQQFERQNTIQEFDHYRPYRILEITRDVLQKDNDTIALRVLDLLRQGRSPAEIREILNINVNVYNAARKTISRRMNGLFAAWRTIEKGGTPAGEDEGSDHA